MKIALQLVLYFFLVHLITSCDQSDEQDTRVLSKSHELKLVWSDEFDVDGLPDKTKWNYEIGDGCPRLCGWGNNEQQYYTLADSSNARVVKGNLIIEAHKSPMGDKEYTSARIITKNKGDWKYGKISIRAKLPSGIGTWPAIWMLPSENKYGNWPNSGEIDIMEHVGYAQDSIYGTVHTSSYNHLIGNQDVKAIYHKDVESAFKTYSIVWNEYKIEWFVDDVSYHTFENRNLSDREWPFDEKFHLIMNIAVGGKWGGRMGIDNEIWPQRMEVDWIRIYQTD